jgi:hypothetical protein
MRTPRARLITVLARWAGVFLGSAVVLEAGIFLWGGYQGLGPVGVGIQALVVVLVVLGLAAAASVLFAASTTSEGRFAQALGVVAAGPGSWPLPTRSRRVLLALPFSVLALSTIAVGILHITVWNPLSAAPGLTLDEIYAAMAAADEGTIAGPMVFVWAFFWGVAALLLPILSGVPRLATYFTARRIVVAGLLLVGGTALCHGMAGFSMGMSLGDTFSISGGDAAPSGAVIAFVGLVAIVAAIWNRFVPRRIATASVEGTPQ